MAAGIDQIINDIEFFMMSREELSGEQGFQPVHFIETIVISACPDQLLSELRFHSRIHMVHHHTYVHPSFLGLDQFPHRYVAHEVVPHVVRHDPNVLPRKVDQLPKSLEVIVIAAIQFYLFSIH